MDERAIKRIVITLLVAIAIIMLAKFMLTKTYTNLNKAADVKKQSAIQQQTPTPSDEATTIEMPVTVSSVEDISASAVESTAR